MVQGPSQDLELETNLWFLLQNLFCFNYIHEIKLY